MNSFSRLPIGRQLVLLLAVAVALSALVSAGCLAIYESLNYWPRQVAEFRTNTAAMAEMIAPAVDFGDDATAAKQLAALNRRNEVRASAVYAADERLFASHTRDSKIAIAPQRPPSASDGTRTLDSFTVLQPIQVDGRIVGTLWVVLETPDFRRRLYQYAAVASVSILALATVALILSFALRSTIIGPLQRLAEAARSVTERKNLGARVEVTSRENEVGSLGHAFNEMIAAVETRERENQERQTRLARQTQGMVEIAHLESEARGDVPAALERFTRIMARVQDVDRVGIWLLDNEPERLRCAAGFDVTSRRKVELPELPLAEVPVYAALLRSRPEIVVSDLAADESLSAELRARLPGDTGGGALLDLPIRRRGQVVGVLCHRQFDRARTWSPEEIRFAAFAADHVAMLFEARDAQIAADHLQASEERFRHLVENSSELIALIDEAGRYHYASPNHETIVGYSSDSLVGRTVFEFLHPEDMTPAELARRFNSGEQDKRARFRLKCGRGEWRWFETSGRLFTTGTGERRAVLVSRDITEQLLSEERFVTIFNLSPIGLIITSFTSDEILVVNEAASRLLGVPVQDLILGSGFTLWSAGEREEVIAQVRRSPKAIAVEKPLRRPDGTTLIVEAHFSPIEIGAQSRLLVALLDVTENRRAQETLRESEERYRTLINEAKDAIFTLAPDGRIMELNDAVEQITGWDRRLWIGRAFSEALLPEDQGKAARIFAEVLRGGHPPSFELRIRSRQGLLLDLEFAVSAHYKDGEIVGLLGIGRDVTERKLAAAAQSRLEAQLRQAQKMESIGTLAGGIAHDFNNMLTGIMGYTQLATLDLPENHPVQDHLRGVTLSSNRARDLVRQILTFSRLGGERKMGPMRMDLLIKEVLELLRPSIPANIALVPKLGRNLPLMQGDPTLLHQVVVNLVTNAFHAIGEAETGRIELGVEEMVVDHTLVAQRPKLRAGRHLCLTVTDTGCGMDQTIVERIFEPFFTTKEAGKGTGLGLSVVHGIVEQHGGAILVHSTPGRGSVFQLYFPVAEESAETAANAPGAETEVVPGRGHILVVDDEELVLLVARRFLEKAGYTVTTFSDATRAYREIASHAHSYDLLLADLTMPGMKGTKLAGLAHELRPEMPVLLATGFMGDLTDSSLRDFGVTELIGKPFTCEGLTRTVRRVLDEARKS
jgi:PAS domain S-box-containing protein